MDIAKKSSIDDKLKEHLQSLLACYNTKEEKMSREKSEKTNDDRKMVVNKYLYDFLLYSYFGIESDDLEEAKNENDKDESAKKDKIIKICTEKAYLDMCRTLKFADPQIGKEEDQRKKLRDRICKVIIEGVKELLEADKEEFNEKHEETCFAIIKQCKEYNCGISLKKRSETSSEVFHYGQAQKWLNITLKYMWLLGLWNDEFEKIESVLHFPVDSYIIDAIKDEIKEDKEENIMDKSGKTKKEGCVE